MTDKPENDEATPEEIDILDEPEPKPESYPCPAGFDPAEWAKWPDGNKRSYHRTLRETNRIIGGK